jgi:hypothetical protein
MTDATINRVFKSVLCLIFLAPVLLIGTALVDSYLRPQEASAPAVVTKAELNQDHLNGDLREVSGEPPIAPPSNRRDEQSGVAEKGPLSQDTGDFAPSPWRTSKVRQQPPWTSKPSSTPGDNAARKGMEQEQVPLGDPISEAEAQRGHYGEASIRLVKAQEEQMGGRVALPKPSEEEARQILEAESRQAMVRKLLDALKSEDRRVRLKAEQELDRIPLAALETSVPVLIEALHDRNGDVRIAAIRALGSLGPRAKDAEPALIAIIESSSRKERRNRSPLFGGQLRRSP